MVEIVVIIPLSILLVLFIRVIFEVRKNLGEPNEEYQKSIERRAWRVARSQARVREHHTRIRHIQRQQEILEEEAAEQSFYRRWGWSGSKWEWDD